MLTSVCEKPITPEDMLIYLPEPKDVKDIDGRLGIKNIIPLRFHYNDSDLDQRKIKEYIAYSWKHMYEQLISKAASMMLGRDYYFVIKFYPKIDRTYKMSFNEEIELILYMDVIIAQTKNVVIPEIIYAPYSNVPKEWRCGSCHSVNPMSARYCGEHGDHPYGCGSPRALLIQEMYQ